MFVNVFVGTGDVKSYGGSTSKNSLKGKEKQENMNFVTKCALKGEQMLADAKAFHPVITGVVVLAMVGIVFGIMVILYEVN
jgi:hypothetical protein